MSKKKYNLLIVAHPDDETIFFGGLLQQKRSLPWHVFCATDGNADGQGAKRAKDFAKACKALRVESFTHSDFPDVFDGRLDLVKLTRLFAAMPLPAAVYTHGPVGEYGHAHHQDVGLAAYRYFSKKVPTWGYAYNCFPDVKIQLTREQFDRKTKILSDIYGSETQRFQNILPATATEGFCKFSLKEVEVLYRYYTEKVVPVKKDLQKYKWLLNFFELHRERPMGPRLF